MEHADQQPATGVNRCCKIARRVHGCTCATCSLFCAVRLLSKPYCAHLCCCILCPKAQLGQHISKDVSRLEPATQATATSSAASSNGSQQHPTASQAVS